MAEPELVLFVCARCGSRLQVLGQAQVWCRCGSPMQPVARDLKPMGMAQPACAPVVEAVAGLVQRSMFDAVTDSQPSFPTQYKRRGKGFRTP